jgi:endo-1,4-beta-D-glucanase Y
MPATSEERLMSKATWQARYASWFSWFKSGAGPYFNGGVGFPYHLKNFNYAGQTAYASNSSKMVTLSEGQSYGMLYALMADDFVAFNECYKVLENKHKLSAGNIATGKSQQGTAWSQELADFMNNLGVALYENGTDVSLNSFGWIWSEDYDAAGGNQTGLASFYLAPDGDVVIIGCLLLAYERWNIKGYLIDALASLNALAQYGVRKCGTRYALTMGGYRGGGGFENPAPIALTLDGSSVFPGSDQIIFNDAGLTTGDAVRLWNTGGATAPAPLAFQDGIGTSWPKYYVRVNGSFNLSFYPTKADAVANTNIIDITTTGSGLCYVYPYETQGGQVATNPSYLFSAFFLLFAKYDSTNAAIWTSLATNSYGDITDSCTRNFWNMPTYLEGVNINTGARELFNGNDATSHQLDAIRVALNMAFDGSAAALTVLKTQCTFNGSTQKWEPNAGASGGIWRYFLDTGFIPSVMEGKATQVFTVGTVDTTADTVDLGVDYLTDNSTYSNPITIQGTSIPGGLNAALTYYPRKVSGTVYQLHLTQANALANTSKVDITSAGSTLKAISGFSFTNANVNTTTDVITVPSSLNCKTGSAVYFTRLSASTSPTGLTAGNQYYIRFASLLTCTLHSSSAGAIANTGKVDITAAGSGTFMLSHTDAPVSWYYRGGDSSMSPYGAAQIMATIYALNGYIDAETFYNALPSWIQQQVDGSYVESNGDYYVQHALGWLNGIMAGAASDKYNGRGYLVFSGGSAASDAATALAGIQSALAVTNYGNVLGNGSGSYAVPVTGPRAYDTLSSGQKSSYVKQLPAGTWKVAA